MKQRILVLGEICSDIIISGEITRSSPEDKTVPVLKIKKIKETLGMAGNVFNNLSSMGARVQLLTDVKIPRIKKIRVYNKNKQIVRIDYDKYKPDFTRKQIIKKINKIKDSLAYIIISDYGKGYFNKSLLQNIIKLNIPVLVDPYSTTPISWYKGCNYLIPNLKEALELTNKNINLFENISDWIIIKASEAGCYLKHRSWKTYKRFKTKKIKNPQVCGAGDTFISAFAYLLILGYNIDECCIGANMAAGIVVKKPGTACVTEKEFKQIIKYLNK